MLRLCVTLSVLLCFQAAGIEGIDLVQESCENTICQPILKVVEHNVEGIKGRNLVEESCNSMICHPILKVIEHNDYEELEVPSLHWLQTSVNGTDMETAIKLGLDRLFSYSRFHNDAGTIVPISAPWGIEAPFENGIIKPQFSVSVSLPLQIQTPPLPKDPSVQLFNTPALKVYESQFVTVPENGDYGRLANELKKKLENDNCSFDDSRIIIGWYNKEGHMKLSFFEK